MGKLGDQPCFTWTWAQVKTLYLVKMINYYIIKLKNTREKTYTY